MSGRRRLVHGALGCLLAVLGADAAPVKQLQAFDAAGNRLFRVAYEYDSTARLIGGVIYDRGDYVLKRVDFSADGTRYLDPSDYPLVHTSYAAKSGVTEFTFFDAYQKGGVGYRGSYSKTAGAYAFSTASGVATHSLSYAYRGDGRVERIDVRNAKGTRTHYFTVSYGDDNAVRGIAARPAGKAAVETAGRNRLRVRFVLDGRRTVLLEVFDLAGRRAAIPLRRTFAGGAHSETIALHGSAVDLRNGLWVVRFTDGERILTKTVGVVR